MNLRKMSPFLFALAWSLTVGGMVLNNGCEMPGNGNANDNTNDNTGDNGNDNTGDNGNDNTGDNGNDNTGDNGNDNTGDNGNDNTAEKLFAGAATCMPCHMDAHADWSTTAHSTAFETLSAIGQDTNAQCLPCHTVGFEAGGFVDIEATPEFAGVQCENCHGSALEHAADPANMDVRPTVNLASTVCGQCHTDAHHPTFDEWSSSKHGNALAGLLDSGHAQDSCLQCHSYDYRYAIENELEPPTTETAELSLECGVCHAPHGNTEQDFYLRQPIADLCGECHTQGENALPGNTPHHPQFEMVTGDGAVAADNSDLTVAFSPHASLVTGSGGEACAQCHVIQLSVEDPTLENPNFTGHTFNPFDESLAYPMQETEQYAGCTMCHSAEDAAELRANVQEEIEGRLADLAGYFDSESADYIDPETLSDDDAAQLAIAKFNYQFVEADSSRGVHNSRYARAALDVADEIITALTGG